MTRTGAGGAEEHAVAALVAEAGAPDTPGERLRELIRGGATPGRGDWSDRPHRNRLAVLRAVAGNPNAPPDVLLDLVHEAPSAVCANPVLPLLLLEAPHWAREMDAGLARRLLHEPAAPAALVGALAAHPEPNVADAARLHISVAGEAGPGEWEAEVRAYWRGVAERAVAGDFLARQAHIELVELGLVPTWAAGPEPWPTGGTPETPARLLRRLESSPRTDPATLAAARAALDPEAPVGRLLELSASRDPDVTMAMLLHPRTPTEAKLKAIGWSEGHQLAAAGDPGAPPEVLNHLATMSRFPWVRRHVWRHPNRPLEVRGQEARLFCGRVLAQARGRFFAPLAVFAAYLHPSVPGDDLRRAADAADWRERLAAAVCLPPGAGRTELNSLAVNGNRLVRAAARARLAADRPRPFEL